MKIQTQTGPGVLSQSLTRLRTYGLRLACMLMFLSASAAAEARTLLVAWDANPEPNVVGYILYYGTAPRQYSGRVQVGNVTSYAFNEPEPGRVYYFALQAVNNSGAGGGLSTEISSTNLPVANFDGDARSDYAVFRPSTGYWSVHTSLADTQFSVAWGQRGDVPFSTDVDGDGKSDLTVFRPGTGFWFTLLSSADYSRDAAVSFAWGAGGDVPLMADFDGDSKMDYAVFRPSIGTWFIRHSNGSMRTISWGTVGDVPLTGDFDSDGKADLVVYRPTEGRWFVTQSSMGYPRQGPGSYWVAWGTTGDQPHIGDFNGDGLSDMVVFRPSSGYWFARYSTRSSQQGGGLTIVWGGGGDESIVGDWDGDSRTDLAVYRPSEGRWYVLQSSTAFRSGSWFAWGAGGDIPLAK